MRKIICFYTSKQIRVDSPVYSGISHKITIKVSCRRIFKAPDNLLFCILTSVFDTGGKRQLTICKQQTRQTYNKNRKISYELFHKSAISFPVGIFQD